MFGPTQTNLTPPPFIKVHVLSQEREQSCICMLVVSILSLFYDFAIYFGIVWLCVLFLYLFFNLESSRKACIWRMQVNFIVLISFTYIVFFLQIKKGPQQLQSFTEKSWNKRCSNRVKGCSLLCVHLYCYRFKRSPYINHVPDCLFYLITISCCFLFTRHYNTFQVLNRLKKKHT